MPLTGPTQPTRNGPTRTTNQSSIFKKIKLKILIHLLLLTQIYMGLIYSIKISFNPQNINLIRGVLGIIVFGCSIVISIELFGIFVDAFIKWKPLCNQTYRLILIDLLLLHLPLINKTYYLQCYNSSRY